MQISNLSYSVEKFDELDEKPIKKTFDQWGCWLCQRPVHICLVKLGFWSHTQFSQNSLKPIFFVWLTELLQKSDGASAKVGNLSPSVPRSEGFIHEMDHGYLGVNGHALSQMNIGRLDLWFLVQKVARSDSIFIVIKFINMIAFGLGMSFDVHPETGFENQSFRMKFWCRKDRMSFGTNWPLVLIALQKKCLFTFVTDIFHHSSHMALLCKSSLGFVFLQTLPDITVMFSETIGKNLKSWIELIPWTNRSMQTWREWGAREQWRNGNERRTEENRNMWTIRKGNPSRLGELSVDGRMAGAWCWVSMIWGGYRIELTWMVGSRVAKTVDLKR